MGLDIWVNTLNFYIEDYFEAENIEFEKGEEYYNKFWLSREFCTFMSREGLFYEESTFYRIEKLTNLDLEPIKQMLSYPDEMAVEAELEFAEDWGKTEQQILDEAEAARLKLQGNLDLVLENVSELLEMLTWVAEGLVERLRSPNPDPRYSHYAHDYYFDNFLEDQNISYVRNRFGQDLRNFKRYLEFLKEQGKDTVWFSFG